MSEVHEIAGGVYTIAACEAGESERSELFRLAGNDITMKAKGA